MSGNQPPPRRRIAGEAPATPPATAKKAPAKKAPATKAPAKKAAAKQAPAKKAPAKKAPAKKAPATKVAAAPAPTGQPTPTPTPKAPAKKPPVRTSAPAAEKATASTSAPQVARRSPRERTDASTRRSTRTDVAAAVTALVLVGGAVLAWFGFDHWRGDSFDDSRADAVAVASKASEAIFSFSYDELDEHATESKAFMTPSYAKQFDTISPALTDIAPQRKVVVQAVTRNAAALPCGDECSADKAKVLVFVDQDRRLADDDTSTVFGNRIEVELVRTDGDWKVDDIRAL